MVQAPLAGGGIGPPALTVAVVSWNTRLLLESCLDSLHDDAAASLGGWVVDNASSHGSVQLVRERYPWVELGFGRAMNLVAARMSTPWLAPANADCA